MAKEYIERINPDGSKTVLEGVRFVYETKDPQAMPRTLRLLVRAAQSNPHWRLGSTVSQMIDEDYFIATVAPGESVLVPEDLAFGVHETECLTDACKRPGPRNCRNPDHKKLVTGGQGAAWLKRVGSDGVVIQNEAHPAVVEPPPPPPIQNIYDQMRARARQGRP